MTHRLGALAQLYRHVRFSAHFHSLLAAAAFFLSLCLSLSRSFALALSLALFGLLVFVFAADYSQWRCCCFCCCASSLSQGVRAHKATTTMGYNCFCIQIYICVCRCIGACMRVWVQGHLAFETTHNRLQCAVHKQRKATSSFCCCRFCCRLENFWSSWSRRRLSHKLDEYLRVLANKKHK